MAYYAPRSPAGQWQSVNLTCPPTPSPYPSTEERVLIDGYNAHTTAGLPPSSKETKEWISLPLRLWSVGLFIALSISLIIAIIVLLVISLREDGFVTVGETLYAYGTTWRLSLLWTTLPSLVFTCLGLHWGAIASAASDRQPFVGLNRPDGGPAKETVLLDYRATVSFIRWWAAFRNRHWLVGSAQLAALVFTVLSPLAASLFVATAALSKQEVPVVLNSTFDQRAMNSSVDIRVVLDAVTSTLIYGASDHAWTDHEHAFRPFYTAFGVGSGPAPGNATSLTAPTVAHSGYLNCAVLEPGSGYDITVKSQSSSSELAASLVMTSTDRGCPIRQEFTVAEAQSVYFATSAEVSCGVAALYSRLVFTYGHLDTSAAPFLANASVVSCAVGYRKTNGDLSVTVPSSRNASGGGGGGSGSKLEILRFSPTEEPQDSRDDGFGFWRVFERKLFQSSAFSADTIWSTTDFGTVILYRALQLQGGGARSTDNKTVLSGSVLAESISDVFTSLYLTSMATAGLVPQERSGQEVETATLETELTRLFVVPWVAGTVIGILALILAVAVWALQHARSHKTLLYEEPAGLLAYAGLLEGSELTEVARRVRNSDSFDGRVVAAALGDGGKGLEKGGEGHAVQGSWKMEGIKPRLVIACTNNSDAAGRVPGGYEARTTLLY